MSQIITILAPDVSPRLRDGRDRILRKGLVEVHAAFRADSGQSAPPAAQHPLTALWALHARAQQNAAEKQRESRDSGPGVKVPMRANLLGSEYDNGDDAQSNERKTDDENHTGEPQPALEVVAHGLIHRVQSYSAIAR